VKIVPIGAQFLHANGQTDGRIDGHDETNSRLLHPSLYCELRLFYKYVLSSSVFCCCTL